MPNIYYQNHVSHIMIWLFCVMLGMNHLTGDHLQQTEFELHGDTGRSV